MKNLLLISFITIILSSCAKENSDVFVPYQNNPLNDTTWSDQLTTSASVNKITDVFSTAPMVDSFEANVGATVHYSEFLDVVYPPAFCKTLAGATVTGKVKAEVTHLRKNGDFIRFARPTTSYGKLLESGGAFFIKVTKDGQELAIDPLKGITLRIRDANPINNMKVFYGEQNPVAPLPLGTNPFFTWTPSTDSTNVTIFTRQDNNGTYRGYELLSRKFAWVNCDYFIDATLPRTNVTAVLPPNFTNANTAVFAVFKEQKVVVQLNGNVATKSFFAPNIPIGKKIIVVAITKIGDAFYLASKDATVENNLRVSLTPDKKTKAQMDLFLDGL